MLGLERVALQHKEDSRVGLSSLLVSQLHGDALRLKVPILLKLVDKETRLSSRSFLEPALTSQLKTLMEEPLLTEQAARRSVI
ncbi:hypothetical protein Bca4012_068418 [Brassica carinata]